MRRFFKIFSHPTILGCLFLTLNSCIANEEYQQISHHEFLFDHTYNVGQTTLLLTDSIRNRPVKTEIWYPTKDTTKNNITSEYPFKLPPTSQNANFELEKHPLILLSHGTGGNRISHMWLACELASMGYIVAAVDHYGNTFDNKIPENFVKVWDRPLDISFTLDKILNHPIFETKIDTTKIGMAGFSLGGYTTIALAGAVLNYEPLRAFSKTKEGKNEFDLPEMGDVSKFITPEIIKLGNKKFKHLKDERLKAFVAMAPAIGQGFEKADQFQNVSDSILIIGAQNDSRTPTITNAKHYHELIKGSTYIELEGPVGHYVFMNVAKSKLKRNAPIIFEDEKSVNRKEIHKNVTEIIHRFFDAALK